MKKNEFLTLDWRTILTEFPRPKTLGSLGNTKLGPVYNFSGISIHSCPGKSSICSSVCYDAWGRKTFVGEGKYLRKAAWYTHLAETNPKEFYEVLNYELKYFGTPYIRIHVGGDFFCKRQIRVWRKLIAAYPDKKFWAYTRSWRIAELVPNLEKLRVLPNMQLFASVDNDTGPGPKGWREAPLEGTVHTSDFKTIICPYETGKQTNCQNCGICFKDIPVNVEFLFHGVQGVNYKNNLARSLILPQVMGS